MQVFIPSRVSFQECTRVLDSKRLQKQLLEASQLLKVLSTKPDSSGNLPKGYRNHPAALAWKHNIPALAAYAIACADECSRRNIKNDVLRERVSAYLETPYTLPVWWGDERLHSSHRARLLFKDFQFYQQYGWEEAQWGGLPESNYLWVRWKDDSDAEYILVEIQAKLSAKQQNEHNRQCEHLRQLQRECGYTK